LAELLSVRQNETAREVVKPLLPFRPEHRFGFTCWLRASRRAQSGDVVVQRPAIDGWRITVWPAIARVLSISDESIGSDRIGWAPVTRPCGAS
jgi:hypothetical protein